MAQKQLTIPLPRLDSPIARVEISINGRRIEGQAYIVPPWNNYFQQFAQNAPGTIDIELTASPFSITPNALGSLIIIGGTISEIFLIRGTASIDLTGEKIIPIRLTDTVQITYSDAPTVTFLPD